MNADQLKGKWMQFKGELKKQYGKFTDDDLRQIEGNHDKFVGKVQERYGDKKDELMKWADQWHGLLLSRKPQNKRRIDGKIHNNPGRESCPLLIKTNMSYLTL